MQYKNFVKTDIKETVLYIRQDGQSLIHNICELIKLCGQWIIASKNSQEIKRTNTGAPHTEKFRRIIPHYTPVKSVAELFTTDYHTTEARMIATAHLHNAPPGTAYSIGAPSHPAAAPKTTDDSASWISVGAAMLALNASSNSSSCDSSDSSSYSNSDCSSDSSSYSNSDCSSDSSSYSNSDCSSYSSSGSDSYGGTC